MAFESSLMFGIYSQAKLFLRGTSRGDGLRPEIIVPSAMFGGAIISFVLCPTELVKNAELQIQGTDSLVPAIRRYTSPLDCAVQTLKNEGVDVFQVTGIFRGGSATLLRECAGNAVFFTVYEYLRYSIHSRLEGSKLKDGYLVTLYLPTSHNQRISHLLCFPSSSQRSRQRRKNTEVGGQNRRKASLAELWQSLSTEVWSDL